MKQLTKHEEFSIRDFISKLDSKDILLYYLCPLVGLELPALGNKVQVKVDKPIKTLYVIPDTLNEAQQLHLESNENRVYSFEYNGKEIHTFHIPFNYIPSARIIAKGKVTQLGAAVKELICKNSGLHYNVKRGVFYDSHIYLQLMYTKSPLRKLLALFFEHDINGIPIELLSQLSHESPVFIENYIKQ